MDYRIFRESALAFALLLAPCIAPAAERSGRVAEGEALYGRYCSNCHAMSLRGSPHGSTLVGPVFTDKWGQVAPAQVHLQHVDGPWPGVRSHHPDPESGGGAEPTHRIGLDPVQIRSRQVRGEARGTIRHPTAPRTLQEQNEQTGSTQRADHGLCLSWRGGPGS